MDHPAAQESANDSNYINGVERSYSELRTFWQKLQWMYEQSAKTHSESQFIKLFQTIERLDPKSFELFGGCVLQAVVHGKPLPTTHRFDNRYLQLIHLLAQSDLHRALHFHDRAERLNSEISNSLIRYQRIKTALEQSLRYLQKHEAAGATISRVQPVMQESFTKETIQAKDVRSALSLLGNEQTIQWFMPLDKTYTRSLKRASGRDDTELAESKWINSINEDPVEQFSVWSAPNVRVCIAPTGISWREGDRNRYAYQFSDMYHYFRTSGFTANMPVKKQVQLAYFLPRVGYRNYYHSLVDKLPALLGYKKLGLDCPIIAAFQLENTERYFCKLLGIDPSKIICDTKGEVIASRGIIPIVDGLKAPFFDTCRSHAESENFGNEKIYISRINSEQRPLDNENAVHELVESRGYKIIHMEDHTLPEQIEIAANATTIVAPHGAGLSNMIFARENCAIVELLPDRYMTPLFKKLAMDCNHRYSPILGQLTESKVAADNDMRWTIDIEKLASVLDDIFD